MPRTARGTEPIVIVAATKVTESERAELIEKYGTMYGALRAAVECITKEES
jgi:hypothetical protein